MFVGRNDRLGQRVEDGVWPAVRKASRGGACAAWIAANASAALSDRYGHKAAAPSTFTTARQGERHRLGTDIGHVTLAIFSEEARGSR